MCAFRRASFFAIFLHASVSVCAIIQIKLHILASRNRYDLTKIVKVDYIACNFGKEFGTKVCSSERALIPLLLLSSNLHLILIQ